MNSNNEIVPKCTIKEIFADHWNDFVASMTQQNKASVTVNIPRDSRKGTKAREAVMEVTSCQVNIMKLASVKDEEIASKLAINLVRITELNPPNGRCGKSCVKRVKEDLLGKN